MADVTLTVASGEAFSIDSFSIEEHLSRCYHVSLVVLSENAEIDLEAIVGKPASFALTTGLIKLTSGKRLWSGYCSYIQQTQPEPTGLSTYAVELVPMLWLLTQRRGHRIFQHLSIPDIVTALLGEWGVTATWTLTGSYRPLEMRVQYGETDFDFCCRLLEEAGIGFYFPADGTPLVFFDQLSAGPLCPPLPFVDNPNEASGNEFISHVQLAHGVRPGARTRRDYDFRRPTFTLEAVAPVQPAPEAQYEQYAYEPGSFLAEAAAGGGTPVADDKGIARREVSLGTSRATLDLTAVREGKRQVTFSSNVLPLVPGTRLTVDGHPHPGLAEELVVADLYVRGATHGQWRASGRALYSSAGYRPPQVTAKPVVHGMQSATVVGPPGEEIYVDEFGRVRVQFPWDREGTLDDNSCCWLRVSQGWSGVGYGMLQHPRIGQEVLVAFVAGDPDQPVVAGRVFNAIQQVPYKLPDFKTRSTWKSNSSPTNGGFNEILFEDLQGSELVYMQAEKNQRRWVKNDEVITIGHDRQKLVKLNETETTLGIRTEVTVQDRIELSDANRVIVIGADRQQLVKGNETIRTDGTLTHAIVGNADIDYGAMRKVHVGGADHLHVGGDNNVSVDGALSLTVGTDHQLKVGVKHALDAGSEIHLKAGMNLVVESGLDLTLKGAGGFIRIDATGVTIVGTLVKINSGGAAGSGGGSSPSAAEDPAVASITPPEKPEPDDVSVNGLAQ